MSSYIKLGAAALAALFIVWFSYDLGYEKAKVEGELQIEVLKLTQAEEIIAAQNKVKVEYEAQIKSLSVALADARNDSAERLRQLDAFRNTDTDLATCRSQRNELSKLAVEGESLLREADAYLGALIQKK